jgi:hypothetical protein
VLALVLSLCFFHSACPQEIKINGEPMRPHEVKPADIKGKIPRVALSHPVLSSQPQAKKPFIAYGSHSRYRPGSSLVDGVKIISLSGRDTGLEWSVWLHRNIIQCTRTLQSKPVSYRTNDARSSSPPTLELQLQTLAKTGATL